MAVVSVLGILLGACGSSGAAGGSDGPVTIVPPAARAEPVDLSGKTLDSASLDIAEFRGDVVVLNVWGSWCPPCRKEAPELERAYRSLRPRGVQFLGIDTRDNAAAASAFVVRFGITYPSLVDDGTLLLAFRGAVPAAAVPTTLVLDRAGRIAARVVGGTDATTVEGLVGDVLSGASVPAASRPGAPRSEGAPASEAALWAVHSSRRRATSSSTPPFSYTPSPWSRSL
ncbi:TlpA disulfide reductase family protein [Kineosporia sp. R_H_3]|uniref:TlpA family protein disulfide reductase n=1 Tax=Kineosporia sp. R_H_3 TaxID=1961848 RepID=UPI001E32AE23|nr:TlpA disulfide reductase family protein [Kineosporia sp. R_H_3]